MEGVIGEGGIGRISKARDTRLGRHVAIKELLSSATSQATRFVREARITARLQHPAIVSVHEVGCWPSGEPFFAMTLINGRPLGEIMKGARSLDQRLALLPHLYAVADAMAYAHAQHIIHRDLKPANILVGQFGEAVVIDWGLAKDLMEEPESEKQENGDSEPREGTNPEATVVGTIMGTPAYMPPEQACARRVDERADVYAIGALLYRALAGAAPYEGKDTLDVALKVLGGPPKPLASRQPGIPEDLIAIVEKAMAREPDQRYRTAKELSDDLRRFQTGQIVGAHQYSRKDLARRFVRRWRVPLIAGTSMIILLATLGTLSLRRIISERNRAQVSEAETEKQRAEAEKQRTEAKEKQAEATRRADELTLAQARSLMEKDPSQAVAWLKTLSAESPRWPAARTLAADALSRGIGQVFQGHTGGINAVAFSPDGLSIATASDDRTVRIWTLDSQAPKIFEGHSDEVWSAAFSPDGTLLATGGKDKDVRLWDLSTGSSAVLIGHEQWVTHVAFSSDGKWLVSQGFGDGIFLWNVAEKQGSRLARNRGGEMSRGPVFSADGRLLVYVENSRLVILDLAANTSERVSGQVSTCTSIAISPDAKLIATGASDGSIQLWSSKAKLVSTFPQHKQEVTSIVFSKDGNFVFSGSKDRAVRSLDVSRGANRLIGQYSGEIKTIELSPDGKQIAAVGKDRSVVLWEIESGQYISLGGFQDWLGLHGLAFSPDGKRMAAAGFDQTMRLWNIGARVDRVVAEQGEPLTKAVYSRDGLSVIGASAGGGIILYPLASGAPRALAKHDGKVLDMQVFPDGSAVASAGEDGVIRISQLSGEGSVALRGTKGGAHRIAISPDGKWIASGGADKKVRLWEVATGNVEELFGHDKSIEALVFSPDGHTLATGSEDSEIRTIRLPSGERRTLGKAEQGVRALAFTPDGKALAVGSMDHTIRLWDLEAGTSRVIDAGGNGVKKIVFFPDGKRFVSLGSEPSVRVWDFGTGKAERVLRGHDKLVEDVSVSPDGKRIVSASVDGQIRIWDLESREDRKLLGHSGAVSSVSFSPDGRAVISAGQDGTVRLWGDDLPAGEAELRAWMDAATKDVVEMR